MPGSNLKQSTPKFYLDTPLVFFLILLLNKDYSITSVLITTGVSLPSFGGALFALLKGLRDRKKWLRDGLEDSYNAYLKPPDYQSDLGKFHEVNEDLHRVFDLLVNEPALIFIDDLDRCSPARVVEVVEAINLMMNGSLGKKCYFIIGMDAQMVAAALDVAYEKMHGKLLEREKALGSIGWYFLDKFVQLPFIIPSLGQEDKEKLMEGWIELREKEHQSPHTINEVAQHELEQEISQALDEGDDHRIGQLLDQMEDPTQQRNFEKAFIKVNVQKNIDSEEIQEQLKAFAPYLQASPRSIKRFINLMRFYTSQQKLRKHSRKRKSSLKYASTEALAKWLTLSLRWPQLVRWVQWEYEEHLLQSGSAREKAHFLDHEIEKMKDKDPEKAFEAWLEAVTVESQPGYLPWLKDKSLFQLLLENNKPTSRLEWALECDVW